MKTRPMSNEDTNKTKLDKLEKLEKLHTHLELVRNNCFTLGKKLFLEGEEELGLELIVNGRMHDLSKFKGIEWDNLISSDNETELKLAIKHHQKVNKHHPEYWGNIRNMPEVYLAEFVCDIHARSSEFGTDTRKWMEEKATEKYDFSKNNKVWKSIKRYLDLLLEKPFK